MCDEVERIVALGVCNAWICVVGDKKLDELEVTAASSALMGGQQGLGPEHRLQRLVRVNSDMNVDSCPMEGGNVLSL